jgi:hypothetical protein
MGTSEVVAERAISLVREGVDADAAVEDLRATSLGKRVAVVMAKQRLEHDGSEFPEAREEAIDLLDLTLKRGDWT